MPLVASLAAVLLLSSCVSQGTYDEVVAERDQLLVDRALLQRQNQAVATAAKSLQFEVALRDREIAHLEREQRELEDDVARWAVRGAIKMQLLADGLHLTLPHDVLFQSGSVALKAEGVEMVKELAAEIANEPYQIAVLGFTDNVPVGPDLANRFPTNWELAGARAASVVRVMEAEGIPSGQLIAISRGETGPIASNDTPEGRAENRRIDIRMRPVIPETEGTEG
jgi:chemotaxis protein MotB